VRAQFTEKEIVALTYAIAMINTWNRLAIAVRAVPAPAILPKIAPRSCGNQPRIKVAREGRPSDFGSTQILFLVLLCRASEA
jgi:hypothetical protein